MKLTAELGAGARHQVAIVRDTHGGRVEVDGVAVDVVKADTPDGALALTLGGRTHAVWVAQHGETAYVHAFGRAWTVTLRDPVRGVGTDADESDICLAPMPGTVVELAVAVGDCVSAGQTMIVIESMKMQLNLEAARDGVVAELPCAKGDIFDRDALLVRLEAREK
ncbi:acyl-CoA carboxylase biotin/lipoyl carrier (plasmid) [Cupriavidus necator N-1]|uniref:Acyl-CoA carboxylase biotin/lipoyl carrier n=1 Tax=Cupriavidus necator (strain ATCC 43291 / DSM 13513 / CCUG 52238 / LMG 8453 / N-1) TaxID=1042878 RepID=F8GUA4_CUPNN|nr:biotin/lipoyl-containing protein [Cupriavidus necator]AEI82308.1 acyl-CoA carboxylase biotin/lipoyl carrier [Cupriavidus necator N-1]MDX6007325.1 biotin/lipoyl-containing protein [Cupriavidus necator]